jgi:hypothetical protein
MTYDDFTQLRPGEPFAQGELVDSPAGINMTGSDQLLRWIAVKGWANDWCVYAHFAYNSWGFIQSSGDKVHGADHILKCVPCDDAMLARYRY